MGIEDSVIPARFLVTLGHLIGVLMVFKTKSDNVYAGLAYHPSVAEIDAAKNSVDVSAADSSYSISLPITRALQVRFTDQLQVLVVMYVAWWSRRFIEKTGLPLNGWMLDTRRPGRKVNITNGILSTSRYYRMCRL